MLSVWAQAGPLLGACVRVSVKVKRAKARQAWVGLAASSVGSSRGTAWGGAVLIKCCCILQRRRLCKNVKPGTESRRGRKRENEHWSLLKYLCPFPENMPGCSRAVGEPCAVLAALLMSCLLSGNLC